MELMDTNGHSLTEDPRPEIARLSLLGHTPAEIHKITGTTQADITRIITSLDFAKHLEDARRGMRVGTVATAFEAASPIAQRTVMDVMLNGGTARDRLAAAFGWLDRSGHGPRTKTDVNFRGVMVSANLTEDDLKSIMLKRFMRMRGGADGSPSSA